MQRPARLSRWGARIWSWPPALGAVPPKPLVSSDAALGVPTRAGGICPHAMAHKLGGATTGEQRPDQADNGAGYGAQDRCSEKHPRRRRGISCAAAKVTAPAAEVLRNPRRVGDDDVTDMVLLLGVILRSGCEDATTLNQSSMRLPDLNVRMVDED